MAQTQDVQTSAGQRPEQAITIHRPLRRTAIELAAGCLARYKALVIDGTPDDTDASLRGTAFHLAAHLYIETLFRNRLVRDHRASTEAFHEAIVRGLTPGRLVPDIRTLFDAWTERFALDLGRYVSTEQLETSPAGRAVQADLVYADTSTLELIDFKTYFRSFSTAEAQENFQARWMMHEAMDLWPYFKTYRFTFDFVRLNRQVSMIFPREDLETLEREVQTVLATLAEAARTNQWPPTAGPQCGFCTLSCELQDRPHIASARIVTSEQAHLVAQWLTSNEVVRKAFLKGLNTYCELNGPLLDHGMEWAHREANRMVYPAEEVLDLLSRYNISAETLSFPAGVLKTLMRQVPALAEKLLEIEQVHPGGRFSAKTLKGHSPRLEDSPHRDDDEPNVLE